MPFAKLSFAALAVSLLCPLAVSAQEHKPFGIIVEMVNADTACNLTLRDDAGKTFYESADFPICQRKDLLNKRVALTYKQERVQAASCQGDPNCKKSDIIMLVVSARLAAATTPPAAPAATTPALVAGTNCSNVELVVFSCSTTNNLTMSVCSAGGPQGYIQYRQGKQGAAPDFTTPAEKVVPARAATGEHLPFAGGGGMWMRFKSGSYGFVTYSGTGRWGRNGASKSIDGIVIEKDGKRTTNVKCVGKVLGEGPDIFERLAIKTGGQTFDFPTED